MRNILFVLSVLAMMVVVGCSTPTTDNSVEEETVTTTETPQTLPEDKSPFEYVKPACVNLADYTYVGDYIFADTMNFAEWKYSNASAGFTLPNGVLSTGYVLAFEKIARVKNDNPNTRIYRYMPDTQTEVQVIKATKYKIYVKTSVIETAGVNTAVINLYNSPFNDTYDGSRIRIFKNENSTFTISGAGNESISDYVAL
jgi:hypothetical protein